MLGFLPGDALPGLNCSCLQELKSYSVYWSCDQVTDFETEEYSFLFLFLSSSFCTVKGTITYVIFDILWSESIDHIRIRLLTSVSSHIVNKHQWAHSICSHTWPCHNTASHVWHIIRYDFNQQLFLSFILFSSYHPPVHSSSSWFLLFIYEDVSWF